jgi:cell wall-associated NlpC family hydrolase
VFNGRKHIRHVIAGISLAALGSSILFTLPSQADPDIDDVQARVDVLYHEAEQASERYNMVGERLKQQRGRLASVRADLDRQQAEFRAIREQVAAGVVAQSQGQTLDSTSQLLLAEDPDDFLSRLSTISAFNDQRAQMMTEFAAMADRLERREGTAARKVARIAEAEATLAAEKAKIDEKAAEAAALLAELEAEERARLEALREQRASRSSDRVALTSEPAASGGAAEAVAYALAQVGDVYAYGATGESAFDCSGLTMRAWAQAGVVLSHSSSGQLSAGSAVSQSELQPGDLVFYYSPVSHVGIYIGNGQIVHAANPSTGVATAPVSSMPYSGAVRPG